MKKVCSLSRRRWEVGRGTAPPRLEGRRNSFQRRQSMIGSALWGQRSKVGYINLVGAANPVLMRGLRGLAIPGWFDPTAVGVTGPQQLDVAPRDLMNVYLCVRR